MRKNEVESILGAAVEQMQLKDVLVRAIADVPPEAIMRLIEKAITSEIREAIAAGVGEAVKARVEPLIQEALDKAVLSQEVADQLDKSATIGCLEYLRRPSPLGGHVKKAFDKTLPNLADAQCQELVESGEIAEELRKQCLSHMIQCLNSAPLLAEVAKKFIRDLELAPNRAAHELLCRTRQAVAVYQGSEPEPDDEDDEE